jgi:hypothetical protein
LPVEWKLSIIVPIYKKADIIDCSNYRGISLLWRPGSVVGKSTAYGPDGPGIESRLGRDIPHLSRAALRPTQPPVQWIPGLSRGKVWPGRDADPSPASNAQIKNRAIPLLPLRAFVSYDRVKPTYFTFLNNVQNCIQHPTVTVNSICTGN